MHTFLQSVTGSVLFGTNNENSDIDYKYITIPSADEILLGKAMESKFSTSVDEDVTTWSFQKWITLLLKMDSNAYEILFSEPLIDNEFREFFPDPSKILHDNRDSAMGFIMSSVTRYGTRGQKLESFIKVVEILERSKTIDDAYFEAEDLFGVEKHIGPDGVPLLSVNNKKVPFTSTVKEALKLYGKIVDKASHRAVEAIGSHDWKGIAHGLRIAKQMEELLSTGEITFPLNCRETLLAIREGKVPFEEAIDMVEVSLHNLKTMEAEVEFPTFEEAREYGNGLIKGLHKRVVTKY